MNCSQVLPGAVNSSPCSLSTGYCAGEPFIVYASGGDVIVLDGHLQHVQTIRGSSRGYGVIKVSCIHCSEKTGKLAVAWGSEVVVFRPFSVEDEVGGGEGGYRGDGAEDKFPFEWSVTQTLSLDYDVLSMCWNAEGTRLLMGGASLTLWEVTEKPNKIIDEVDEEGMEAGDEGVGPGGPGEWDKRNGYSGIRGEESVTEEKLEEVWRCSMADSILHLKFSPSGTFFASCGQSDCLVKIWYPSLSDGTGVGSPSTYSFCYIAHPQSVRGFVWRRMTTSFPRGCIPNVLMTHCTDNICRIWSHSLAYAKMGTLRFFIAASIDPVADIPFRTTMPLDNQPFIVHWLNNKETTLTSKVDKFQKGISRPISHFSSVQSFTSNLNEEMMQSWVCIDEDDDLPLTPKSATGGGGGGGLLGSKTEVEMAHATSFPRKSLSLGSNLHSVHGSSTPSGGEHRNSLRPSLTPSTTPSQIKVSTQYKRALSHLLDEWCSTPDLLLSIHPTVGSLMVWTVEGIDAPPNQERLVHVSFSSCLPHVFPPHLSQSLQPDLLQFLIREPDAISARSASSGGSPQKSARPSGAGTDISLPVPQIRLSSSGSMPAMSHIEIAEDVRKVKPDSTLILVSSHSNGSLNTWSVELTVQSNYCTSIAGLIRCAGTGGHRSKVTHVHRHPWLPVLMTISSPEVHNERGGGNSDVVDGAETREGMNGSLPGTRPEDKVSELIIWNADLPGPLQHRSKLNELSRITSHDLRSFKHVTWVPPISMESIEEGALARCPSQGLFVANVGQSLVLFQASLYSITKPQPSSFMQSDKQKGEMDQKAADAEQSVAATTPSSSGPTTPSQVLRNIQVASQLGVKGVEVVSIIMNNLFGLQDIIGLHIFRMCSLVTTTDLNISKNSKFCKDAVLVLLENRKPEESDQLSGVYSSSVGLRSKKTKTYLHMWRLCISTHVAEPPSPPLLASQSESVKDFSSNLESEVNYSCELKKVFSEPRPLPLPKGAFVVESSAACDISSSLQLQTPTLSAPYLFSTACSDGVVRCWQFNVEEDEEESNTSTSLPRSSDRQQTPVPGEDSHDQDCCGDISFTLYEVFGSGSKTPESTGHHHLKPRAIDCLEEEVIRSLPTESYVPVGIKVAYPGRLSMAHLLSKPVPDHQQAPPLPSTLKGSNPNDRHSLVTIWECESSGGLQWSCEATLQLVGVAHVAAGKDAGPSMKVLMEWLPMENGAYLLATCFASTISIFGMALPRETEQFAVVKKQNSLRTPEGKDVPTLSQVKARASWVCLLEFPCLRLSADVPINCLAYTGTNSLLVSIRGELQLYSCWVNSDKLAAFGKQHESVADGERRFERNSAGRIRSVRSDGLGGNGAVNLLDYAHTWNTPLPQYHPKVLLELMNSGRLPAVKSVLVNLIRFLLLYRSGGKKKKKDEDDEWSGFDKEEEEIEELENGGKMKGRKKHLSLSSEGFLERSRQSGLKNYVDVIPQLPLSKMGIVSLSESPAGMHGSQLQEGGVTKQGSSSTAKKDVDDYDELFSVSNVDDMELDQEETSQEAEVTFADLSPSETEFTAKLSSLLSSLLEDYQLPELNDLDHLQLVSIAHTLASTSQSGVAAAGESNTGEASIRTSGTLSFSILSGAGYASSSMSSKGREAMDDCGLRYLLALESSVALTACLPEGVLPAPLPPSSLVWAFHSDAEAEILSAIPCVLEDRLEWEELRKAGVGWWLRSVDTLKRLIEKLAKAMFMKRQQPLDASIFYLAMKKQSLMKTLFKSVADSRMSTFFGNDFTTDRWKKAAQKNAFALLGKQRFEEAAAFFLLAGKLWDAVEVCVSRMQDLQLAFVLIRLYEGDHGPVYHRFLKERILGVPSSPEDGSQGVKSWGGGGGRMAAGGVAVGTTWGAKASTSSSSSLSSSSSTPASRLERSPDPFLRSMVHWLLQDYSGALETLLIGQSEGGSGGSGTTSSKSQSKQVFLTHPAIFNYYFFLRNHPVLLRRDYKSSFLTGSVAVSQDGAGKGPPPPLSSVGDEPLTPVERSLLFSTAYHHLCHGCPLLALNVLQRLPKSSNLGVDIFERTPEGDRHLSQGGSDAGKGKSERSVLSGMLLEGSEGSGARESAAGSAGANGKATSDDDFDWGAPVSSQVVKEEEEDLDWSKPFSSGTVGGNRFGMEEEEEAEFDWSKPVSSTRMDFSMDDSTPELSPTHLDEPDLTADPSSSHVVERAPSVLTPWGFFILALAGQLQYNACLSILTEELHSIYVPSCCLFLWEAKSRSQSIKRKEESILPLTKPKTEANLRLLQHYNENVFDRTLQNLRGTLVDWLREEAATVKSVTSIVGTTSSLQNDRQGREDSVNIAGADENLHPEQGVVSSSTPPSGYDLLTTLMNYSALHAATSPNLLTVKFELMHLVNTTLPWGEGLSARGCSGENRLSRLEGPPGMVGAVLDRSIVPTLAVSPSQLPILTSCSLPVKHLTNLATHLRLLSDCIVQALSSHVYPPISTQSLPQVHKIFELCCAISHCLTISLNPVQASEMSAPSESTGGGETLSTTPNSNQGKIPLNHSQGSLKRTPTPSSGLVDIQQQQPSDSKGSQSKSSVSHSKASPSSQSPFLRRRMDSFSNLDSTIGPPNTKPSKWPGLNTWPAVLTSNEGRDSTPMGVVMVECIVSVYVGLFATAWSQHSVDDLHALLKNAPAMESWYDIVGGGTYTKKAERVAKNLFKQTMESMSRRLHFQTRESSPSSEGEEVPGVFVAPRRTLLDLFLSPPGEEFEEREVSRMESAGYYMVGGTEVVKSDEEDDDNADSEEDDEAVGAGITFQVKGGFASGGRDDGVDDDDSDETSPSNPNCYAWSLINVCMAKILQQTVRKMVAGVGLEVLELITVSPLLYLVLKVLDEWESIFNRRLEALGEPPEDLFGSEELEDSSRFKMGVSLMRQKFIMEPENSPFRGKDKLSRSVRKLWQYLVHQSEPRDTILQYLYMKKPQAVRVAEDKDEYDDTDSIVSTEPTCRIIHKENDVTISAICLNSCTRSQVTMLALSLPREILEIEVQEESYLNGSLDTLDGGSKNAPTSPKRMSVANPVSRGEDFIMVQTTGQIQRPPKSTSMSSLFFPTQIRRSLPALPGIPSSFGSASSQMAVGSQQTGSANPVLARRPVAGVKRMAPHPNLSYYLTGSMDGSVSMWEFGTGRPVASPRKGGGAVTKIRFTPEGNKFGVTDHHGNLSLWQGIQTSSKSAYHILHSHMKFLSDFLFLGSSSFIATCGDGSDSKNLYLWDTLMPTHRSIVKEFSCHEGGATALGYCRSKQRLFCGGKKGEVCVFDIRQNSLLQSISLHSSSINCIAVNNIDGYFVTGSADGDMKILDCSTLAELASFPGLHAKSRLFRHGEGGVTDMDILPGGKLYSCGADGTIKLQTLQFS